MPFGFAAGIGAAGAIGGSLIQAGSASNAQSIAENQYNADMQQQSPYVGSGNLAQYRLNQYLGTDAPDAHGQSVGSAYGSLLTPFTAQNFQQMSPAYQFQLQQGQQGVLNGDEAGAGALSGAAQKDLISYNQNMANTSFNNAFNQYQTQQGNIYSRLAGVAQLGQAGASNTAVQGSSLANTGANAAISQGNAYASGISGAASNLGALAYLNSGGGSMFGGGGGGVSTSYGQSTTAGDSANIGEYGTI